MPPARKALRGEACQPMLGNLRLCVYFLFGLRERFGHAQARGSGGRGDRDLPSCCRHGVLWAVAFAVAVRPSRSQARSCRDRPCKGGCAGPRGEGREGERMSGRVGSQLPRDMHPGDRSDSKRPTRTKQEESRRREGKKEGEGVRFARAGSARVRRPMARRGGAYIRGRALCGEESCLPGGRSPADSAACGSVYQRWEPRDHLNNFPSAPGSRSKAPQEWNRVCLGAAEVGGTDLTWPQDSCPGLIFCRAFGTKAKLRPISVPWDCGSLRLSGRAPWGPPSWNSRGEFQRCGMSWDGWCGFNGMGMAICGLQRAAGGMGCALRHRAWGRGGGGSPPPGRTLLGVVVELQFQAGRAATPTNNLGGRIGLFICLPHQPIETAPARPTAAMAATPMDLDDAPSATATPALNITRTIGATLPSTTAVSEIIALFRPTKVRSDPLTSHLAPRS